MVIRNYKYKLYVNKNTKLLSQLVTSSNFAWNHIVALSRRYYKLYGKGVGLAKLLKHMAKLRKKDEFWSKLGSQTMQAICQKYADAVHQHFVNKRGFPKPHKRFGVGSIVFKQGVGYTIGVGENKNGKEIGALVINALGKDKIFKFKVTRPWGDIRTLRVIRDTDGCLYAVIACNVDVERLEPKEDKGPIGLDFGLKVFLTTSNGDKVQMPDFNKINKDRVSKVDRCYSLKKKAAKYGTNFRRAKKAKSKLHRKEVNQRSDFHWKLAHELCRSHKFIAVEDFSMDGMKRLWGRKVSNLAFGEFVQKLTVVAQKYGTVVMKVDRWFASSQTCSECGYVNKGTKDLEVREWVCPNCGVVHDRDFNAAKNILSYALSQSNTGRALPVSGEVVNRSGNELSTTVDWCSLAKPFIGKTEQESHGI